jgi:hypothetical protein
MGNCSSHGSLSPVEAAQEHSRLKSDLDAARDYGDGWWIQEALGALTRFLEVRYRRP